ncbi:PLP-dependent aminotransferase family protein [Salibacterium salarium]|uniref:PLP-dependent aminotransferase family protein n=1 Tax=Salibacterium salarium TaxID=284579 RepID=A0A428MTL2_9BACI|nr:PLP-dependent aminotransferase family protein [Salibacterium salarium]RSL29458.1 PLP-dependent aminotransferase family protein [Salibacterium salarium]
MKYNKEGNFAYINVMDYIENKVKTGAWTLGKKLPTQRDMAYSFNVNRSTIIHAYNRLKDKGILESKTGSGTYVSDQYYSSISRQIVNWTDFSRYSVHPVNHQVVQKINRLETKENLIQLGKGELHHSLFPKYKFQKSLNSMADMYHDYGYNDATGDKRFKEAIRYYLQQRGVSCTISSILPVSGALQALQLISLGLLQYGSTVFTSNISYIHSLHVFRATGMQMKGIPLHNGSLNTKQLRRQLHIPTLNSVLYLNPTFHNPTGETMSAETRREIIKISQEYQLPIIEDDIFRDLWIDKEPEPPIASIDHHGHTLLVGSFSKTIAPTLRIGWIAAPEDVIEKLSDLRMQLDYGTSSLPQLAVYDFIKTGKYEQHLKKLRIELKKRRDKMHSLLEKYLNDIATWKCPEGGMFFWVKFSEKISINELFSRLLDHGILINPGYIYSPYNNQYVRLSYVSTTMEDMETGVHAIKKVTDGM